MQLLRKTVCRILLVCLVLGLGPDQVKAEADTELNIYAIYLQSEEKGDSVLLESEGEYLLVDIGKYSQLPAVLAQLRAVKTDHVDILFSHLHTDHTAGSKKDMAKGLKWLTERGIIIDTLYLPAPELAPNSSNYAAYYSALEAFEDDSDDTRIVYLGINDTVQVGDAEGEVIGPLNGSELSPSKYTKAASAENQLVMYENNCSLAMIFTCGDTRYFTAGDCYKDEADSLVETYGSALSCEIMQLCHHGVGTGNSAELLAAVNPEYSFASNTGKTGKDDTTGQWVMYTPLKRALKYGMCYMVGNEQETLIYHIFNDEITLYQGDTIKSGTKLVGWQTLYGGDGANRETEKYYFDSDGQPVTGVRKLRGKHYYFVCGGRMDYGTYDENGVYNGWKKFSDGMRYFSWSADGKTSYMAFGLTEMGGKSYYFDEDGFMDTCEFCEIDGKDYYFGSDGCLVKNRVIVINDEIYYCNSKGVAKWLKA